MPVPLIEARPVIAIGGPTGPSIGPTGPFGPGGELMAGIIGRAGIQGRIGPTGAQGAAGIASALIGAVGAQGPASEFGYQGPRGPTGDFGPVPPGRSAYFENTQGVLTQSGVEIFMGCKFRYTTKKPSGIILAIFSGLVLPQPGIPVRVRVGYGTGSAPGAGATPPATTVRPNVQVLTPAASTDPYSIPFSTYYGVSYGPRFGVFNAPVGTDFWFDMMCLSAVGPASTVKNVSAIILDF